MTMQIKNFSIKPISGFTDQIGILTSIMSIERGITVNLIKNLSVEELDASSSEFANSIGTLLFHISALEFSIATQFLEGRELTAKEHETWSLGLSDNLASKSIYGNKVNYYLENLALVRNRTLEMLSKKSDSWLFSDLILQGGVTWNNYYLLFHLIEDEIGHRGQMKLIIKRLLSGSK